MTLEALIADVMADSGGLWEDAIRLAMQRLQDPMLEQALREELQLTALRYLVRQHAHAERSPRPLPPPNADNAAGLRGMARSLGGVLYDLYAYPLEGGLRLGDARRPDVLRQAERHRMLAASNGTKHRWFASLAALLTDDAARVRDVFSNEDLERLREKAESA